MPEIDKELAKELQQAKKKGRNFAIIAKSANVVKLLLSKKPIRDGEILAAKKESGGNIVVQGVAVAGDGPELVFRVKEETKVGAVKLRVYITENSGLTLKVRFEVQPDLQDLDLDDDDDAPGGGTSSGEVQQSAPPTSTASPDQPATPKPESPVDEQDAFEKRLRDLVQAAKEANAPQLLAELKSKFSEAQLLGRKSDFRGAGLILDGIEQRIADFKSGKTEGEEQDRQPSPGVQDALDAVAQSKVTHRAGFRIACDKWNKARDVARVQMEKFAKAVIDDTDLKSLPVYDQIAANAAESVVLLE
ncbi:MAG TPA: hypothetical protein PLV92_11015, partial [Pirellulaceae bacterium]|nr:hypothetical protein [Pirellulaceae bacterium]